MEGLRYVSTAGINVAKTVSVSIHKFLCLSPDSTGRISVLDSADVAFSRF
jgi:hypothetical protein